MKPRVKRTSVKNKVDNSKFRGIDLFEDYENIPKKVNVILEKYQQEYGEDYSGMDYKDTARMLKEIEREGYTFGAGLDNQPYGLRPIGVRLNQLEGFEMFGDDEYRKGGKMRKADNGMELSGGRRHLDYYLVVDIDERGEYGASVYNPEDNLVFSINDAEEMNDLIEMGYLESKADEDLDGLTVYLVDRKIIPLGSQVYSEAQFERMVRHTLEEDEIEYETNDECIEAVVDMARGVKEVADFFIVDGKLIIVFKNQLMTNEMDKLNSELQRIRGCGEVFEDSFEMGYGEGYKTITLELKTDDIEVGKFGEGGGVGFRDGEKVKVNGKVGTIVRFDKASGSYVVYTGKYESEFYLPEQIRKYAEGGEMRSYQSKKEWVVEAKDKQARKRTRITDELSHEDAIKKFYNLISDNEIRQKFQEFTIINVNDGIDLKIGNAVTYMGIDGTQYYGYIKRFTEKGNQAVLSDKEGNLQGVISKNKLKKIFAKGGKFAEGGSIAEGNYHMILSQAKEVKHHVDELQDILKKEDTIEAWVVAKMENVSSTLSDITHYLDGKSEMPKAERGMKVGKTTNKNYEIVTISQGEEGGRIYNFRFLVNANSLEEAKKIAKDKWKKEFSEDLSMKLIDTLSDEEYREKFLRETGGKMPMAKRGKKVEKISDELIEYSIPTWALPSLINGDDSGLRDEDIEKINKFVDKVVERHGNAFFMLGDMSEESNFQPYNDIDSLGADVTTLYIRPSKKFEKGGITYPSLSLKEKDLNDDQAEIYGFIENYEPLNRQLDAIRKNLMTKIAREQFDETKAPKIFMYLIDNGLKAYEKMHGDISLTKKEKEEIANNMVIDFMSEAEQGNYENETFLPKKYLNDGGMMVAYSITDDNGDSVMIVGSEQDVIDFANTVWYYDMMDEDGEEIDDFDVAKDYLEQSEFVVEAHNKPKSATKKKNVRRGKVK
jgi:hypothetical protein